MDVRMFTVGPMFQENCFLVRRDGADRAVMVDPGDEAEKLIGAIDALGVTLDAILLTHTHIDHIAAVAPVARQTGAPVYCPKLEVPILADGEIFARWGMGRFEPYEADETVEGGERLELAGFDVDVIFTPGHSPGHVTYSIEDEKALFSGDVLFQGSVGRVDLPGGDWQTLADSIAGLLDRFDDETTVYPGHMGITTLGRERATNSFLAELV
ncbi:MAG TPA: MBL fold metallo-hydrolase [Solirubrobacteraceae bacterium]|nr:MBL fold metallo-hydrolase [Solirubrobacteraceae bacterium]